MRAKYLILGAGVAGLTFAESLLSHGEKSFVVLEKEADAGGLCRSREVDGSPLDIGGGHFLDVRRKNALDFIFRFMPQEEWNLFTRISKIDLNGREIDYPFESNIWQLPVEEQLEYIESIADANYSRKGEMPATFIDWIDWKLGKKIADTYMLPYNEKIWSMDLNRLGTYWLDKLPDVSFTETLLSCIKHSSVARLPGHAHFYYPKKYGYGEVWGRIAENLKDHIAYQTRVEDIDFDTRCVNGEYTASVIVNTVPWSEINPAGFPETIRTSIAKLEHTGVDIDYIDGSVDTKAHWTYFSDRKLSYHRILYRNNFCPGSRGYWTETNILRRKGENANRFTNEYAYPLNTIEKPQAIRSILDWAKGRSVFGLGRWGEWQHLNSDVAVEHALALSGQLLNQ